MSGLKNPLYDFGNNANYSFLGRMIIERQLMELEVRKGNCESRSMTLRCPLFDDFMRVADYCKLHPGQFSREREGTITLRKVVEGREILLAVHYVPKKGNA